AELSIYSDVSRLDGKSPFSLVPAIPQDQVPETGVYFVSSYSGGGDEVSLFYFNEQEHAAYRYSMRVGKYAPAPDALQNGSSRMLDAGDCRISGAFLK